MATASLPADPDEMECSVCHEHFTEPKVLPCGHLLCHHCLLSWLQSQAEALCPLCRCSIKDEKDGKSGKSLADIADSFLTDRAMAALVEAHRLLSEQHVCCVCDNVAAVSMCMDCGDMFCQHCSNVHKKQSATKHHAVEQLISLTEEKLAANFRRACAVHSDKLPEVFCPSHGASVCLRCATTVHRQCPDVKDLEERVREARDTLHELTVILTARETEVGRDITRLDQQLTDIDQHTQAAIAELTATFDDIEAALKESRRRLNDMIVKTSSDEKRSVSDVRNTQLGQRGKLTLHKRLVARSEAIITRDDVTDMTPDMETLVKDLDRSISSQTNVKVTSRMELAIDPAEVTRIKKALSELGNGKDSSFDDGNTARISLLEQNVQQLQRDLNSAQSERARFAQQATAQQQELAGARNRVQVLEQEVKRKDDQIKQNEAEIASCKDDILSKVKEMKQQKHMYDQLQTELQGEMARHQNTTKQLRDSKKTCSALGNDIASYQRKLREFSGKAPVRKTSVTQPSKSTHQQTKAFRFHDNHGKKVVLSNDQKTAEFRGDFGDGGGYVMSRDPMEVNKLNEVQLTKIYKGMAICVGVVTSSPDSLTLPDVAGGWKNAVTVYHDGFFDHGDWSPPICVRCQTETYIAQALCGLPANSRVGVSVDRHNRRLHVHVNGDDQGVVPCRSLPDPCWAMWKLNAGYSKMEEQNHMIDQTELQAEKARHQDSKEECSALKRRIRELENMTLRFHLNKGEFVQLGIDQKAAQYANPKYTRRGGLVMSQHPMQVNTLYEVEVQIFLDSSEQVEEPLYVGVVTSSPDSLPLPGIELFDYTVCSSDPFSLQAVIVCSGCICDRGVLNKRDIQVGRALKPLKNNSRVGVSIDCNKHLHLHVNGRDQGVVPCQSLPDQCWAMWDMYGHETKVRIPLTDLP